MNKISAMLPHEAFGLITGSPISALSIVKDSRPLIAVIDGKLVKVETIVDPQLSIIGLSDGQAQLGELVILEAKLTDEAPEYIKSAKIKWTVVERGVEKVCWTDGKKVIFGTGIRPTTINVHAKLTLNYDINGELVPLECESSLDLKVGDVAPPPPPTPDPPAPDDIVLEGVAKQVHTWAVALVDSETRSKSARPLAQEFKTISQTIGTEGLADLRSVLIASKARNNEAILKSGIDPRNWDGWGSALQDLLYTKYVNGELKKVGDIKQVFYAISEGLYYSNK